MRRAKVIRLTLTLNPVRVTIRPRPQPDLVVPPVVGLFRLDGPLEIRGPSVPEVEPLPTLRRRRIPRGQNLWLSFEVSGGQGWERSGMVVGLSLGLSASWRPSQSPRSYFVMEGVGGRIGLGIGFGYKMAHRQPDGHLPRDFSG